PRVRRGPRTAAYRGAVAPALDLPRSVLLALWLTSSGEPDHLVAAVQADDEPHAVEVDGEPVAMRDWVRWLGAPVDEVAVVLPVPGEPVAVPPPLSGQAVDAGECVLLRAGVRT